MTIAFNSQIRHKTAPPLGFGTLVDSATKLKYLKNTEKMNHEKAKKRERNFNNIKEFAQGEANEPTLEFIEKNANLTDPSKGNHFAITTGGKAHVFQKTNRPPTYEEFKTAYQVINLYNENKINSEYANKLLKAIQGHVF